MLIPHPVLINPQEQKSEDRVNIPPCLNHSEEQESADLINPEELKSEDHVNTPPCVNQPGRAEIRRSC
jgi:hypothetical protein